MEPIGTEIAGVVTDQAEKTLRQKVASNIYRLIAGGPGFKHLDKIRQNENTIEGRKKVDMIVAEEVARQAISDPEYMERAKARFLGDMISKQENLEAVARKANEQVLELSDADVLVEDQAAPSDDWMNVFTREAEMASSEDLRERLATVLTGEVRSPGSYSKSTVRTVAEIDRDTLEQFQSVLPTRFEQILIKGKDWSVGQNYYRLLTLQSAGLLTTDTTTFVRIQTNKQSVAHLQSKKHMLVFQSDKKTDARLDAVYLTRTGQEIANLLNVEPEVGAVRNALVGFSMAPFNFIYLGKKKPQGNGFLVEPDHVFWDKRQVRE